jgi:hypothetical protein
METLSSELRFLLSYGTIHQATKLFLANSIALSFLSLCDCELQGLVTIINAARHAAMLVFMSFNLDYWAVNILINPLSSWLFRLINPNPPL